MIGLVIVTHGQLAVELRRATEHVVGPQGQLETVCIGPDDDMDRRRDDIRAAISRRVHGQGRDPAHRHVRRHAVQPRDLAAQGGHGRGHRGREPSHAHQAVGSAARTMGLGEACETAREAGRKYIAIASRVLAGET